MPKDNGAQMARGGVYDLHGPAGTCTLFNVALLHTATTRPTKATRKTAAVVSTGSLDWNRPEPWKGALDRSPCGTGTSAKMATLHAKGLLGLDQDFHHEGILGTIFTGRLIKETTVGDYPAVVPTITGQAWVTGMAQYVVDPDDPFPNGFTLGDIWGS